MTEADVNDVNDFCDVVPCNQEGLARRFPNRLHLDDYTPAELGEICEMCARQIGLRECPSMAGHASSFSPGTDISASSNLVCGRS